MTFSEDIFPKPSEPIHKIFRCCGSCPRCIAKKSQMEDEIKKTSIKVNLLDINFLPEEYILICSAGKDPPIHSQMTNNNLPTHYISNYGRPYGIYDHGRGCHGHIERVTDNFGKELELAPLTQEFINYYNSVDFWGGQWNHIFRKRSSQEMIMEYHSKNSNISTAYKIEKDKERIQKMIKDLQEKETEIVNEHNHLKSVEDKLLFQEKTLKGNEQKLHDKINIHKQKSLKLLERENKISVKESVETIQKELLDISLSISEILEVTEEPVLVNRIDQIIGKLNHIQLTSGPIQERTVIIATEVLPEPSAPLPGY